MFDIIQKVTLYVNDQAAAKAFWVEKMGWQVSLELPIGPQMTWVEIKPTADAQTAFVLYSKAAMQAHKPELVQHPSVILGSPDIEALYANLQSKGIEVDALQSMPWGKMFTFKDLDGNPFMVRG